MYWFTKIRQQDKEKTYAITLSEQEAESYRQLLIRNGYSTDEVRVSNATTLEEGTNGIEEHKKTL
jgi:hypothetical protein